MYQETIYNEAIARIQARRLHAQRVQEQRTERIYAEIPETAEIDRQMRSACLALFRALPKEDHAERVKKIEGNCQAADAMMRNLLTQHGYPADYLDVQYHCPICNDTGFTGGRPCACLKREIGIVGAEHLNAQSQLALCSFESFSLSYYRDLPPDKYQIMERIYQQCRNYAAQFQPGKSGNLLMIGNTGLGKTHLSLSIAAVLLQKGYSVIYDSVGALIHKLEQEHFGKKSDSDTLSMLLECDLLILDDFGTEFDTSFSRSVIYTIFNSRINACKPMIVNTNLSKSDLQEQYGNRILSRLFSACIMQFFGRDIRMQKSLR
ncbi:MAG TPA: DNA replication protein DnaC [Ruminococcus sp.]|nr:DNA replication protein DnaC [Ruminococcus sp.]